MSIVDPRARNRVLGLLFVGVLMAALDIAIVGPALPAIQAAFGVSERAMAWVFAIYVLFNLTGTPLLAKLSDRFGRRAIYVLSVSLFAIGSLMVALAPGFGLLLVGRAVQGLGAGGIFPVAGAVIGDTFPPEKRGTALGLIGAVFGIAFLVGPIIGGLLLLLGWAWLFLVNLPIAAAIIVFSLRLLPGSRPDVATPFDWAGIAVLGMLLSAFAFALTNLDAGNLTVSLASPLVWPCLLACLLLLPLFLQIERRAADPVLRLDLFRSRQIGLVSAVSFGAGLSEAAVVFVPALAVAVFGVRSSTASFMLIPTVLAMAVGSPVSGRMLDRAGSRVVVVLGAALSAIGLALLGLFPASLTLYYLSTVIFGLGMATLLGAAPRYIMLNETSSSERAAAQGILTVFTGVGQLIGGVLVGALAASGNSVTAGYAIAFLSIAALMLLLTIAAFGLKGREDERATAARIAPAGSH